MSKPGWLVILFFLPLMAMAQRPLRFYLNADSTTYAGFRFSGQTWLRYTRNNPGTLINGEAAPTFFDISVRRMRFQAYGVINRKTSFTIGLGQNNINYLTATSGEVRLLDMYMEHSLTPWLTVGTGQSAWNGLSRYSAPHTSRIMTLDIPMVAIPTINLSDNILRKLGAFAHGQWKAVDYRVVFSRPYANLTQAPTQSTSTFAGGTPGMQTAAYLKYFILGSEPQSSPFHPFTFMNSKAMLVVGVGAEVQPRAMWRLEGSDTVKSTLKLFAVDVFGELPAANNSVITVYGSFFSYDFGPDFIRMIGVNNIASGVNGNGTLNGSGNRFPAAGTGDTFYGQLGYFIPIGDQKGKGIQFFTSWQYSDFVALADPMIFQETGLNVLLRDQSSKISLALQSWPYYRTSAPEKPELAGRRQSVILQYQVRLE